MKTINRTEFLRSALALTGLGIGAAGLAACSSGGYGGHPSGTGAMGGGGLTNACDTHTLTDFIGSNHGHVLMVTPADATAAMDKTYDIMGTAGHTHSVTITAAMFATLETGDPVLTDSTTTSGHSHSITVMCG